MKKQKNRVMSKPDCTKTPGDQLVDNSLRLFWIVQKKLVENETPATECQICQQLHHIRCQGKRKAEYECVKG